MKRTILATILGLATVGSATAMTGSAHLSEGARAQAEYILPGMSFDNLTASQASRIEGVLSGGKDLQAYEVKQLLETAIAG